MHLKRLLFLTSLNVMAPYLKSHNSHIGPYKSNVPQKAERLSHFIIQVIPLLPLFRFNAVNPLQFIVLCDVQHIRDHGSQLLRHSAVSILLNSPISPLLQQKHKSNSKWMGSIQER